MLLNPHHYHIAKFSIMSTYTKAGTRRKRAHMGSRSSPHAADKAAAERRQSEEWIRVASPVRPSPARSWPLKGHEAKYNAESETWSPLHGQEQLGQYLEYETARRCSYFSQTTRKGKPVKMKRPIANPIEILTTTFSPPENNWIEEEFRAGRDPRPLLALLRNRWLARACARLKTQRIVLAMAVHCDTDDIHIDLACARALPDGTRIGKAGLMLSGPWMVGVDRQLRAGAVISPEKRAQFTRAGENFRRRFGDNAVPLDILLARDLDAVAGETIGPSLGKFVAAYAEKVPELEAAHKAAALAVLDAARAKLAPHPLPSAPNPNSEPSFSL